MGKVNDPLADMHWEGRRWWERAKSLGRVELEMHMDPAAQLGVIR